MVKIYRILVSQSLAETLSYRFTAVLTAIFGILFYVIELVTGGVYFSFTPTIYGWNFLDYLNLITTANLISYLYQFLFVAGHEDLVDQILDGNLDYSLLRPVNAYWFHASYRVDFPSLVTLVLTAVIEVGILLKLQPTPLNLLGYLAAVIVGVAFVFALNQIVVTAAFWIDGMTALDGLPEYLMSASARPAKIYPRLLQQFFLWVIPSLAITNVPAQFGHNRPSWLLAWSALVTGVLLVFSYWEWRRGLLRYVSAN
ncbi:MAG: ABC-2 family transporter protein [Levilactobacillus sp.]|jgi:ABC-2 type transport system permease protein|uniref:ABC transporter permease n=1 Tax=Levilactobacillus sp. TaxID=2767919 RepID=UPI00258E95F1|nr:ABC-2 family transporter protein [Levilactobacillus sp.]MCH4123133.1 ABC-2 family transporter protein [Levilactobacillus sp.]MCI1552729.1 ABC-2 family transporter protein [Levilactobacillus sp.]MCI1598979.1 ABC-2 family transporter protein [Levilactobacillus sp.]MCI1606463.1 ABC-2 family transporter protein [Levilactobacillus sp.]